MDGIYVTICWTSDDCDGQVDLKLHLSVGQVILFPYFDHWWHNLLGDSHVADENKAVLSCRVIIKLAFIFMYEVALQIKYPKEGIWSGLFSAAYQSGDQYYDIR